MNVADPILHGLLSKRGWILACLAFVLVAPLVPADAQYFGRNKVLWERFDFTILETEHFLIHYYPPSASHAQYVARIAERWYSRLSGFFNHEFEEKKPLIIYADHADFQQTVVTSGLIGEGTGGFTESLQDRVVLPLTGINADNDHVIGHELVHAFQFDIARSLQRRNPGLPVRQVPLWVIEGLAEYLSQGRHDPATALWMRDAVLHQNLPELEGFIRRQPSPYQYGQAVWAYVAGHWGDETVKKLFLGMLTLGVSQGIERVLGVQQNSFFNDFHEELRTAFRPLLEQRSAPAAVAQPLLIQRTTDATVNLAPALSPDGQRIAFLSTRELALDLYLADAQTGQVERRLVSADADPHFDNLSFIDSSVAWSPDGTRFAFSVFARGERRLAIYDVARNRVTRVLDLPGIRGMRHPAWFPDGSAIVFSAIAGGASDLFRVDLETGHVTRLTDDAYTAIQPSVSPDGRHIAFVTDRGPESDLEQLHFGPLQLALLDVESGDVQVLHIFEQGKHIDPDFSTDGTSLYFIGEPDGVPDVFRYDLANGAVARLTAVNTGVTGITQVSPALSVAGGTIAFSVLEDGNWSVYRMSAEQALPAAGDLTPMAGVLPPLDPATPEIVEDYLGRASFGLADSDQTYLRKDYEPRIRLVNVGPATVGVGTSVEGTAVGGALSAYFSDPLNRHQIVTTIQGGSTQGILDFGDTLGLEATYLNQSRRFQWGARASRLPFVSSGTFFRRGSVEIDDEVVPADVIERVVHATQETDLSVIGQYPLSLNQRIEFGAGVSRIDFKRKLERLVYPAGLAPFREEMSLPSPASLDLTEASVAFVRDTSRFGYVSPVRGSRFRIENQWTSGDLSFQTTLLDYRRYFFARPLTFAFRVMHLGRHGEDADDPRLAQLDVGTSSLVRGYELGSFELSECTPVPGSTRCPEFDRLVGSRIAVLNFEVRLPVLGTDEFGLYEVPAAPTEAVFFIDAGAAWTSHESVEVTFERDTIERVPVVSAGIAARSLIFGAFPFEVFYAFPFQRPDEDGVFGFRIGVGW